MQETLLPGWQQRAGFLNIQDLWIAGDVDLIHMNDLAAALRQHVFQPIGAPAIGQRDEHVLAKVGGIHGGAVGFAAHPAGVADEGIGSFAVLDRLDVRRVEKPAELADKIGESFLLGCHVFSFCDGFISEIQRFLVKK